MSARKTITVITSPQSGPKPLPNSLTSPTKSTSVYRIEERSRTIYVAGDVDPSQWDTNSLNAIFSLAEVPEEEDSSDDQPIRRTHSYQDTQLIITPEAVERVDEPSANVPSSNVFRSRRLGVRSANAALPSSTPRMSTMSPYSLPQLLPQKRILFYHKHDPYYGFTNFSAHPVVYDGKKYPTSEHLFQSFKVCLTLIYFNIH